MTIYDPGDVTPPDTTITGHPANPSSSANATFTFTSTENLSAFECALDGASFTACTTPAAYSLLALGSHTFRVRATDFMGNVDPTPASYTWTIAVPPPTVMAISPTSGTTLGGLAVTITGTGFTAGATVTIGGTAASGVIVVSPTTITAITAAHVAGAANVVVTNPDAQQGILVGGFAYTKAPATVVLDGLVQTYDGTPRVVTATTTPPGLAVTFSYTGTGGTVYGPSATAPTNAGSYTVSATISDQTYQGTAVGTLTVSKAMATVVLGDLSQSYDGSPKGATVMTTPSGLTVAVSYSGSGGTVYGPSATAPTDAGIYNVTATVNDQNYQGSGTGTLAVSQATAAVALGGLTQTYDGTPKPATATTTPSGLIVTFGYTGTGTTTVRSDGGASDRCRHLHRDGDRQRSELPGVRDRLADDQHGHDPHGQRSSHLRAGGRHRECAAGIDRAGQRERGWVHADVRPGGAELSVARAEPARDPGRLRG